MAPEIPGPDRPASPAMGDALIETLSASLSEPVNGTNGLHLADVECALLRLQRRETIGLLAAEMAHDISNLMTVMLGYAELLAAPPDDQRGQYLGEIRRAAEEAAALTRQLLDFCRLTGDGLRGPVNPADVVLAIGALLSRVLEPSVQLAMDADADCGFVLADPLQLEQVIVNLVLNARDASPKGGSVAVSVAPAVLSSPFRHALGIAPAGAYVRLRVRDRGHGIDPEMRARLFRPFAGTKPKGTGLGLAIVARIVRQSQGAIAIESAVGAGTTVDVYFPRLAE